MSDTNAVDAAEQVSLTQDPDVSATDANEGAAGNQAPTIAVTSGTHGLGRTVSLPATTSFTRTTAADIDGDGDLDLIGMRGESLALLRNNGDGTFEPETPIDAGSTYIWEISSADIDGDGRDDLVLGGSGNDVRWLRSNGDGTFESRIIHSGETYIPEVRAFDVDGDGRLDLVSGGVAGEIILHKNNGDGTFTAQAVAATGQYVGSVTFGDVNDDGKADIIAAQEDGKIQVILQQGDGTFALGESYKLAEAYGVTEAALADIDGDGTLDIVGVSTNDKELFWAAGNGDGTFGEKQVIASAPDETYSESPYPSNFRVLDVNGDGRLDIVSASTTSTSAGANVSWHENRPDGTFVEHVIKDMSFSTNADYFDIIAGDFNGDGALDIVRAGRVNGSDSLQLATSMPSIGVQENQASALTRIVFADTDANALVSVTLTVPRGTLSAESGSGVTVTGDGQTLILEGSISSINAFIAAGEVSFLTARHDEAGVTMTVTINDLDAVEPVSTSADILLDVTPMQDAPPVDLALDNNSVAEDAAIGHVIGHVSATDPEGEALTYSLRDYSGLFELVGTEIRLKGALDREAQGSYEITVSATDAGGQVIRQSFTITVTDVDEAPTSVSLSRSLVAQGSPDGTIVGTLSAVDPEGGAITYSIADDQGAFRIEGNQLVVQDLGTALKHSVTVVATDSSGNTLERTFQVMLTDEAGNPLGSEGTIVIDASTTRSGMDFEAYIRGGFVSDTTGGGFPVFDNGPAFSGEEMFLPYGDTAASKYVLAHGSLEYYFTTHTVWGEIGTIEYGSRGQGSYDADGYFTGGDVDLRITGLSLANGRPTGSADEQEIEANGAVHNFALAYMYGSAHDPVRMAKYADALDAYAQHFKGSAFNDVFTGTVFGDTIEGGDGDDQLYGAGGNDLIYAGGGSNQIEGGDGTDTVVFSGLRASYDILRYSTVYVSNLSNSDMSTVRSAEFLRFDDVVVNVLTGEETPIEAQNGAPTDLALSNASVAENSDADTVVGTLSATDPDGDTLTYTLTDDADGRFGLVTRDGVTRLVVKGALDFETAASHVVTVRVTDTAGNEVSMDFTISVTDVDENPPADGLITIDATGATAGMDFEAFIRGGFVSDTTGGGMPVFDNSSSAFSGEEMFISYGAGATDKYVFAHGSLEYYFNTHTVWGEVGTIEYGTRGSGSFGANGYFTGGNAELRITGLSLANARPNNPAEESEIEANGPVHNFAVAHMYGSSADPAKLGRYADALDARGQHFKGSAFGDTYTGTAFGDLVEGNGGADLIFASLGNDTIDGGAGADRVTFAGQRDAYTLSKASDGTVTIARMDGLGTSTLRNVEIARFDDIEVDLATLAEEVPGRPPEGLSLSGLAVNENAGYGTVVGVLSAFDPEGKAITYSLANSAGGLFFLDGAILKVGGALDHETHATRTVTVVAEDADGDRTTASFTIAINDVNEAPADLFLSKARIKENAEVGTRVGTFSAYDPEGDAVSFSLLSSAGGRFKLSGDKIMLAKEIDYDKVQSHVVTIKAVDGKGGETIQSFRIDVDDVARTIVAKSQGGTTKGGAGIDIIRGSAQADRLWGGGGNDQLKSGSGNDALYGEAGDDKLWGGNGQDVLNGGNGNDFLSGQSGNDRLEGGFGADRLSGGAGADTFVFKSIRHSTVDAPGRDTITDFSLRQGDRISLSSIDADVNRKGNQAFSFVGRKEFSEKAGELRYEKVSGQTYIYGDVNGDGEADFAIQLKGAMNVNKAYFIL